MKWCIFALAALTAALPALAQEPPVSAEHCPSNHVLEAATTIEHLCESLPLENRDQFRACVKSLKAQNGGSSVVRKGDDFCMPGPVIPPVPVPVADAIKETSANLEKTFQETLIREHDRQMEELRAQITAYAIRIEQFETGIAITGFIGGLLGLVLLTLMVRAMIKGIIRKMTETSKQVTTEHGNIRGDIGELRSAIENKGPLEARRTVVGPGDQEA